MQAGSDCWADTRPVMALRMQKTQEDLIPEPGNVSCSACLSSQILFNRRTKSCCAQTWTSQIVNYQADMLLTRFDAGAGEQDQTVVRKCPAKLH